MGDLGCFNFQSDSDPKWPDCPHMPGIRCDTKVRPTTLNPSSSSPTGGDPRCAMEWCPDKGSIVSELTLGSVVTAEPVSANFGVTFDIWLRGHCPSFRHPALGSMRNFWHPQPDLNDMILEWCTPAKSLKMFWILKCGFLRNYFSLQRLCWFNDNWAFFSGYTYFAHHSHCFSGTRERVLLKGIKWW